MLDYCQVRARHLEVVVLLPPASHDLHEDANARQARTCTRFSNDQPVLTSTMFCDWKAIQPLASDNRHFLCRCYWNDAASRILLADYRVLPQVPDGGSGLQ